MPPLRALIQQTAWVLYINWGTTTVAELIIATTLVYWLYQQRTAVNRRTTALVNKIIQWTLETGVLLSAATSLTLICFLTMRENYIWIAVYVVQARLYSNTFLASLNSRATLRAMNEMKL
ncbi:hypothetical protein B0H13DRAFT_768541 [Mycena leptocephala]|nr:hypothetical protein B0H13DRAFT_768541 [Mycena leptocephala]